MKQKILFFIVLNLILSNFLSSGQNADSSFSKTCPMQLTFIYPLGTNGTSSGKITNNFSFNLFAGHNGGVYGMEIGGFSNNIRHSMSGLQLAGFSNVVLEEMLGCQISGFSNYARKTAKGCQISGFSNVAGDSSLVSQIAGFTNLINGTNKGMLIAGFSNLVTGNSEGIQISGFSNITRGDFSGCQISGFSGVVNGNMNGLQISGFANTAKKLNGTQIAFINICDTVEKGFPFGFVNIVKNGYRGFDIRYDESNFLTTAFHTGINSFYNIFSAGAKVTPDKFIWSYGYGLGSKFRVSERIHTNLEIISSYIATDTRPYENFNMIGKLQLTCSYGILKHIHIYGGASMNIFVTNKKTNEGILTDSGIVPWSFYRTDTGNFLHKFYPGFSAGIRIF